VQQNEEALMYAPEELQAKILNSSSFEGLKSPINMMNTNRKLGAPSTSSSSGSNIETKKTSSPNI
jgi:hypothetical protein